MIGIVLALGLAVGVLVGLLGIGGGVVLVPAMVYLLGMDQHLAQGTSLFMLLPPVGLGALREYWRVGQVDLRGGIFCAAGMLAGGYAGGLLAVPLTSRELRGLFGWFLMLCAVLLWRKSSGEKGRSPVPQRTHRMANSWARDVGIFLAAALCGIASGLFGIGGGILLVPMLVLLFSFGQHRAQGTSLVALIPPTGLLAFVAYARAGYVSWRTGLLLIPGVFIGGIAGAWLAKRIEPRRMRQVFVTLLFLLGAWQAVSAMRR